MKILLIEDRADEKQGIFLLLKERFSDEILIATSLQEGIEISETGDLALRLVVCDYHGNSTSLIKCLLSVRLDIPYIVITHLPAAVDQLIKKKSLTLVETVNRSNAAEELPRALDKLSKSGLLRLLKIEDSEFIRMTLESFRILRPLNADVYIRLGEHKYVRVYLKEDQFERKGPTGLSEKNKE